MDALGAFAAADEKTVIRASALTYYPDCERRGAAQLFPQIIKARGFDLRETPVHVGAPIGSATHAGAAFGLKRKIETGELSSLSDAVDVSMASLDDEIDRYPLIDWKPREAADRDQAQKQVKRMVAMVHTRLSPTIMPAAVEDRLIMDLGNGFVLSGQRDVYGIEVKRMNAEFALPTDTGAWIISDLKTGARYGPHIPQTGGYILLAKHHGNPVDGARIMHVRRAPLSKPQPEPIIIELPIETAQRSAMATCNRIMESVTEFTKTGSPHAFLANASSIMCGEGCPAHGTNFCREHLEMN